MTTIQPTSAICPRSSEAAGLLPASWSTCCVLRPISANCRQSNEVARLPQTDVRLKDVYGSVVWIGVVRRQATDDGNAEYQSFPDGFASTQICPHQRQKFLQKFNPCSPTKIEASLKTWICQEIGKSTAGVRMAHLPSLQAARSPATRKSVTDVVWSRCYFRISLKSNSTNVLFGS